MTKLSVNINKVATLRNARGGNYPDVERFALDPTRDISARRMCISSSLF